MKLVCDAIGATHPVVCSWFGTIGTSYTEEVLEDMDISAGVAEAITVRNIHLFTKCLETHQKGACRFSGRNVWPVQLHHWYVE